MRARAAALLLIAASLAGGAVRAAGSPAQPLPRVSASAGGSQALVDRRALVRTSAAGFATSGDPAGDLATLQRFVDSMWGPADMPPAAAGAARAKDAAAFAKDIP
jgi:hypothetical protein